MCNACGFLCCASDEFGGCGCDHCDNPACWPRCEFCGHLEISCACGSDDDDFEEMAP